MLPDSYLQVGSLHSPQSLHFVGGRVASLGRLAKLRPTFEVHNICQISVLELYCDCP